MVTISPGGLEPRALPSQQKRITSSETGAGRLQTRCDKGSHKGKQLSKTSKVVEFSLIMGGSL